MNRYFFNNITTSFESYRKIINFYHKYKDCSFGRIEISFQQWFTANLCSALGGIIDKLKNSFNDIFFDEIQNSIKIVFQKNDFLSHFGFQRIEDSNETTIKFLKLKPNDRGYFNRYISDDLLNNSELPSMGKIMKKNITQSISELFTNSVSHSKSEFIYTCGQFFPKKKKIEFTITDTGIGFKNKINNKFNSNLSSIQAIKWAMADGNSTKETISGGLGLAIFKEFIKKNRGKLQIISDDGFYQFDSYGEITKHFDKPFPGTIVNMQIRTADEKYYYVSKEEDIETIF